MTEQQQPTDLTNVLAQLEDQQRAFREQRDAVDRALSSPAATATARYVHADGNGVTYREFLREIGGILRLVDYCDGDQPDPERVNAVIDRIHARTATRQTAGGITITYGLKNREQAGPDEHTVSGHQLRGTTSA